MVFALCADDVDFALQRFFRCGCVLTGQRPIEPLAGLATAFFERGGRLLRFHVNRAACGGFGLAVDAEMVIIKLPGCRQFG